MRVDGACHCGAISYTAQVDPATTMLCHCTDCQVLSGSPFRVVVAAAVGSVELRGTPREYVKVADSGVRRVQAFCPDCGTPLFSRAEHNPVSLSLRVGAIRQRAQLEPSLQLWHRSSLPWLERLQTLRACDEQEAFTPK